MDKSQHDRRSLIAYSPPYTPQSDGSGEVSSSYFPPPNFSMPPDFQRGLTPSNYSVIDANSVVDAHSKRMYQGYREGQYYLPNDGQEQERLDIQHQMYLVLLDYKLYLAPIDSPKYVLDVATGTGIWAHDFARAHSDSHVIGTDLSKIQPIADGIKNVEFIVDDSEEPWVFPQVPHFDYIHLRMVFSCFDKPRQVMQQAFDHVRPGGWVEYQDCRPFPQWADGSAQGASFVFLSELFGKGLARRGRDVFIAEKYKDMLRETGFVDVHEKVFAIPLGRWPDDPKFQEVGAWALKNYYEGMRGITWKALEAAGKTENEIETINSDFRRDATNPNIRSYSRFYVVYARKPFPGEVASNEVKTEHIGFEIIDPGGKMMQ